MVAAASGSYVLRKRPTGANPKRTTEPSAAQQLREGQALRSRACQNSLSSVAPTKPRSHSSFVCGVAHSSSACGAERVPPRFSHQLRRVIPAAGKEPAAVGGCRAGGGRGQKPRLEQKRLHHYLHVRLQRISLHPGGCAVWIAVSGATSRRAGWRAGGYAAVRIVAAGGAGRIVALKWGKIVRAVVPSRTQTGHEDPEQSPQAQAAVRRQPRPVRPAVRQTRARCGESFSVPCGTSRCRRQTAAQPELFCCWASPTDGA